MYIHIPYCKQKCSYCSFVTFRKGEVIPSKDYVKYLKLEIQKEAPFFKDFSVETIYFGGGTPGLIPSSEISDVLNSLYKNFSLAPSPEITIEMNPGMLNSNTLSHYLESGINRFSLGVQTFKEDFLKKSGRLHSQKDSLHDLKLLSEKNLNYSLDLLFGIPDQNLKSLKSDVKKALEFHPPHLSAYNLTIPKTHELSKGRASEREQAQMFFLLEDMLSSSGLHSYEISNFARKDHESRHNLAYWSQKPVLGLGVSAHSYLPPPNTPFGVRFWNASKMKSYLAQTKDPSRKTSFPPEFKSRFEILKPQEALTDFCYTRLRKREGLFVQETPKLFSLNLFLKWLYLV